MSHKHTESRHIKQRREYSSESSSQSDTIDSSSSSEGHFRFRTGDYIKDYKIKKHISDGTFGRVLKVKQGSRVYAMKIVRRHYKDSAKTECEILRYLNKRQRHRYIVELIDSFSYHGHYVLVFERLGPSLYALIRKNRERQLPMDTIKNISRQLLKIIAFLHANKVTHTDLKPENILFMKNLHFKKINTLYLPQNERIKVIDLGGAMYDHEDHDSIVNTRQYRAPEVQLEVYPWDHASDVWGLGCIIAEMYKGALLFQTRKNEVEHIALMQVITGQKIPQWMARQSSMRQHFDDDLNYIFPQAGTTKESAHKVATTLKLADQIEDPKLRDLLIKMLELDPKKRITCEQALNHEFFD